MMSAILTANARAKKEESNLQEIASTFLCRHPKIFFVTAFVGAPLLLIGAVFSCTAAIILPLSTLMGWL